MERQIFVQNLRKGRISCWKLPDGMKIVRKVLNINHLFLKIVVILKPLDSFKWI